LGGSEAEIVAKQMLPNIDSTSSQEECARKLDLGRTEGWISTWNGAQYAVKSIGLDPNAFKRGAKVMDAHLVVVTTPDVPKAEIEKWQAAYKSLKADGTVNRAFMQYDVQPKNGGFAWTQLNGISMEQAPLGDRSYSLCGVTHTTASHIAMTAITDLLIAQIRSWDALICTSTAVRDTVRILLENQAAYLSERLGATRFELPQLPVIPLGVHTGDNEMQIKFRQENEFGYLSGWRRGSSIRRLFLANLGIY
jgi:hypothetical protein